MRARVADDPAQPGQRLHALPHTLAPAIAPIFLTIGGSGQNYSALFVVGAVFSALAAFAVLRVRTAL
ncbi:hypothetical protein [Pseudonocardia cypriaca]|uniref:hypothetical protein n=1 Tax=Pseudonocardia cypriaca TaxID=882449 RepID=UPI001476BFEC|nr:hypothetical protein [Pseudonocardia cypriaca]